MSETYQLLALRYATREARRQDHFISEVPDPEAPMPMDYFVWLAIGDEHTVLIDSGFKPDVSQRRGRTYIRWPSEALHMVGVDPASIRDIVLTHLHYDHAGTIGSFPSARLHLQVDELEFASGRGNEGTRGAFEAEDVANVIKAMYGKQLSLHNGSASPWPGISFHLVGGHTPGTQVVRVRTKRGWVVLASDASHFYENMERGVPFHGTHDVERNLGSFKTLRELADSAEHVVPGHDPKVMQLYPAPSDELTGVAVRLDEPARPSV